MTISNNSTDTNLRVLGISVDILLDGSHTGGQYSAYKCTVPFHVGPPPHSHSEFDEGFSVLTGQIGIFHQGQWTTIGPGESVFIPRGEVHTFRGESSEPALFFGVATPSGHEQFFRDMNMLPEPNLEAIMAVLDKNGITPAA